MIAILNNRSEAAFVYGLAQMRAQFISAGSLTPNKIISSTMTSMFEARYE